MIMTMSDRHIEQGQLCGELLEALYLALPFIETELDSGCYKKGVKAKTLKQINDAINAAEDF